MRKIGLEVEAWVKKCGGETPADVGDLITRLAPQITGFGSLTREPGVGSIEFVGKPGATPGQAVEYIESIVACVRQRCDITFQMNSPFARDAQGPEIKKPRYEALWNATRQETVAQGGTEEDWRRLNRMNECAATHAHFSIQGAEISYQRVDDRVVMIVNILNLVGPRMARMLCERYHVNNKGHLGIWNGWARPERFTRYGDWSMTFNHHQLRFERIPRLINTRGGTKEEGEWYVDLTSKQEWSNPLDHSSWWHFVRPRPNFGTFEVRLLPSWPIITLQKAVTAIDEIVDAAWNVAPECVGIENAHEFMRSNAWKRFRACKPGGLELPSTYTKQEWQNDVFH